MILCGNMMEGQQPGRAGESIQGSAEIDGA